jgi:hypothetical protein
MDPAVIVLEKAEAADSSTSTTGVDLSMIPSAANDI